jgi:hypothetical protein
LISSFYAKTTLTHNWFGIGLANGSPNSNSILSFYWQALLEMRKKKICPWEIRNQNTFVTLPFA